MDPEVVKSGHVTKEQEKQVLADLSSYPRLAAMLALEKKLKLNKSKNRDNSQLKEPQISTNTQSCSTDHEVSGDRVCKEETVQVVSDLTEFHDLAAMLAFEKAWRENRKTQKTECNPANSTCCSAGGKMSSTHVFKEDQHRVLSDLTDFPYLAAMIAAENAAKERGKRQKTLSEAHNNSGEQWLTVFQSDSVYMEQKQEVLEKQRVPSQPINVNAVVADNREELNKERVTIVKCEDSSIVMVSSQPINSVKTVEEIQENSTKEEVIDVEEDKSGDSSTKRVPSQPANVVNDVEDRKDDQRKRKANVLEEEHWEDSSKNRVEPTAEDKPEDLGISSVPFRAKPLDIYLPQLNKPASELLVETRDNVVHRRKPRGGRYFDDPASKSVMTDKFLTRNRRKPKRCLLCGSLDHKAKDCKQVVDCFICYSRGHLEKNCPKKQIEKDESATLCLKCGEFGHDMFSCSNTYLHDDLKQIQCSVCMGFGHLSCADYMVAECKEPSCYKCGELGHFGPDCEKLIENFSILNPRLFCYRCRQIGHYSRECKRGKKDLDADCASESIIPDLAPIQSNNSIPSSNPQPCNSFSLNERVGKTSSQ